MSGSLLDRIEITHVAPCPSDGERIRINAAASCDLGEALPYLNAVLPRAIYNPAGPALTFNREGTIFTLYSRTIFMAKVRDLASGQALLEWAREQVNQVWARRGEITPLHQRRNRLTELEIYKLLPGTNCRRCGVPTCLAFAVRLAGEQEGVLACPTVFEAAYQDERQVLLQLMEAAGYQVPSAFREKQAGGS